eukprot:123288-Pleurochrysis_carterae.AAC.1
MTLVLCGKAISVPRFDTLRDAGAKEINHNEFAQPHVHRAGMFANGPVEWNSRSRLLIFAAISCQTDTAAGCVAAM